MPPLGGGPLACSGSALHEWKEVAKESGALAAALSYASMTFSRKSITKWRLDLKRDSIQSIQY